MKLTNWVPNDRAMYQSTFQTPDRVKGDLRKLRVNHWVDPPWSARTLYWPADSPSVSGREILRTEHHWFNHSLYILPFISSVYQLISRLKQTSIGSIWVRVLRTFNVFKYSSSNDYNTLLLNIFMYFYPYKLWDFYVNTL